MISDEDKVYMLAQKGKSEYAGAAALYYLGELVSNYTSELWKFIEDGNVTRMSEREKPGIGNLPELLAEGGYTYLWICNTDEYLMEELLEAFECEDEIMNGKLYRIIYEGKSAVGLKIC